MKHNPKGHRSGFFIHFVGLNAQLGVPGVGRGPWKHTLKHKGHTRKRDRPSSQQHGGVE